jgi:hypothetical protein
MYRSQLQHVIFEIGRRFDLADFHIVGSAAILAALPNPPEGALTTTRDADACTGWMDASSRTDSRRELHCLVHGGP